MAKLEVLFLLLTLTCFSQCSAPNTNNGSLRVNNQNPTPPIDYKKLIAGRWKCVGSEIYVTFSDGTITEDYLRVGGEKLVDRYKFKDERTLEVSRYPDNLVIERITDGEIKFSPEGNQLRESIGMIYDCTFVRPLQ